MKKLTKKETAGILSKGIPAYLRGYPTVVSFEMTYSCTCNCHHCNMGGITKDEKRIGPADYSRLMRTLKPVIVQISGGEPLLRDDLTDVMQAVKPEGSSTPYLIVVTCSPEAQLRRVGILSRWPTRRRLGLRMPLARWMARTLVR